MDLFEIEFEKDDFRILKMVDDDKILEVSSFKELLEQERFIESVSLKGYLPRELLGKERCLICLKGQNFEVRGDAVLRQNEILLRLFDSKSFQLLSGNASFEVSTGSTLINKMFLCIRYFFVTIIAITAILFFIYWENIQVDRMTFFQVFILPVSVLFTLENVRLRHRPEIGKFQEYTSFRDCLKSVVKP